MTIDEKNRIEVDEHLKGRLRHYEANYRDRSSKNKQRIELRLASSFEMVERNRRLIETEKKEVNERLYAKSIITYERHRKIKEKKRKEMAKKTAEMKMKIDLKHYNAETIRQELEKKQRKLKKVHSSFDNRKQDKLEAEKLAQEFTKEDYEYRRRKYCARIENVKKEAEEDKLRLIKKQYEVLTRSVEKMSSDLDMNKKITVEGPEMLIKLPSYLFNLKKLSIDNVMMKSPIERKRIFEEIKRK